MYKEVCLLLLLVLLDVECARQVNNVDCFLDKNYVSKSKGTLTKKVNGKLQLQRSLNIKDGEKLTLHCKKSLVVPPETHNIECRRGSLIPSEPIKCPDILHPKVVESGIHPSGKGHMFRIGFEVQNEFLEVYRTCFNKTTLQSFYSEATIYPRTNKDNYALVGYSFTTDELISNWDAASYRQIQVIESFSTIYDKLQNYITKSNINQHGVINRGHLTALKDMLFLPEKICTMKYVNVVPQFTSINGENWARFERWIQGGIPQDSMYHVRTGTLDTLSLKTAGGETTTGGEKTKGGEMKKAYLIPATERIPVPMWMYKLVLNENRQLIHFIVVSNNIFDSTKPEPPTVCTPIKCRADISPEDTADRGFYYCCETKNYKNQRGFPDLPL